VLLAALRRRARPALVLVLTRCGSRRARTRRGTRGVKWVRLNDPITTRRFRCLFAFATTMTPAPKKDEPKRKRPPTWVLNTLTALVGVLTLAAGIGWMVYNWIVNLEIPYFAIPLILTVPVIAAVAFRNLWD
jgi:hypothetical protein